MTAQPPQPHDNPPDDIGAMFGDVLGTAAGVPRPVRWRDLDPQEHAAELHVLADWVRWLVTRYALDHRDIAACWYRHGAVIEELAALRGAWQIAYDDAQAATAGADWHATFAYARQRLRDWSARTGCRFGEHRPDTREAWATDPDRSGWRTGFHLHLDTVIDGTPSSDP